MRVAGIVLLLAACIAAGATAAQVPAVAHRLLRDGDLAVGHVVDERRVVGDEVHSRSELNLWTRQRSGRESVLMRSEYVESAAGQPLRMTRDVRAGIARTRIDATLVDGRWRIRHQRGDDSDETWLDAPPDLLFPAARERLIASGREFTYSDFDGDAAGFRSWRLRPTADPDRWLRSRDDGGEQSLQIDRGRLLEPLAAFGTRLSSEACADDCSDRADASLAPVAAMSLASPYAIPRDALHGTIRYVVAGHSDYPPALPTLPGQQVRRGRSRTVVTVCSECLDAPAPAPADLAAFLQPGAWIQSDDPRIRAMARAAAGGRSAPAAARMRKLMEATRQHLTGAVDFVGYASAAEAWETRSGDCTESALLLAALGRAHGIPTRVVVGVAYASRFSELSDVFSPHMWVQAWTGERWENFDAGLGEFDAGHLAFAVGDGEPGSWQGLQARIRGLRIVDAARIDAAAD